MDDNDVEVAAVRAINNDEMDEGDRSPFSVEMEREVSVIVLGDRRHGF